MFWGLSEALDLFQEYLNAHKKEQVPAEKPTDEAKTEGEDKRNDEKTERENEKTENDENRQSTTEQEDIPSTPGSLNVLLYGAGDVRHVLQTMAKLYKHARPNTGAGDDTHMTPTVNFYVLDGCVEIIARNLALLAIALENAESFNMLSKVHMYMDVYGNSLMRPTSHKYLVGKSKSLLAMVTDSEQLQRLAPLLDLEGLKYRERDGLENAINFWLPKEKYIFDVPAYWEARLRRLLGARYDHRDGVFDWDLNMTLKDRGAQQLCSQEYRYWRETGIAFSYPEYEQCKPNKTLSAGLVRNGEFYKHRGYAGDIETGPFCAHGLRTEDGRMMRSAHGENDYRATDVTERNLLELFHELQTRSPYEHDSERSRRYGAVRLLMGERLTYDECDMDGVRQYDKPWLNMPGVKVFVLSADEVFAMQRKDDDRWRALFDVVFVGQNYFGFLKDDFLNVLRENGLLLLETKLFSVLRRDDMKEFETKLMNYAKKANLKPVINYGALNSKNSMLKYKKVKQDN